MSDNEPMNDDVVIPEDEVLSDAPPPKKKKGLSPTVKLAGVAGIGVLALTGVMLMSSQPAVDTSQMRRPPAGIDSTPAGRNQQESQAYQDAIRTANDNRSNRAAELGITSMPTPEVIMEKVDPIQAIDEVNVLPASEPEPEPKAEEPPKPVERPVERRILPRPQPAPKSVQEAPKPEVTVAQAAPAGNRGNGQEPENPYIASISAMMGATAQQLAPKGMVEGLVLTETAANSGNPQSNESAGSYVPCENCGNTGNSELPDYSPENILLRPGDILYAETLTGVNSDLPSPVIADVVSGEYKGARLVGNFTTDVQSSKMVVEFRNMTFEDGRVYQIQGVAVDGKSAETAVRSDIERRYVARYAPLLASTFISGYARAMAQPKQTVIGTGDTAQVITEQSTERESILAGVSVAASAIANDIASYAPKGPKVILQSGWPIAIMLTEPVLADTPVSRTNEAGAQTQQPPQPAAVLQPVRVN